MPREKPKTTKASDATSQGVGEKRMGKISFLLSRAPAGPQPPLFTHTASVAELSNLSCRHGRKLVFSLRCAYSADDLLCAWLACRSCFCFSYHAPTWERRASSSPDAKLYYAVNL